MDPNPQDSRQQKRDLGGSPATPASPDTAGLAGLGIQFLVAILLFLFVGRWLDARLGTAPWLLIAGVFIGAGTSMYAMYRRVFPPVKKTTETSKPGSP
jgi:F0F1-type ATP synthase assembly protein I